MPSVTIDDLSGNRLLSILLEADRQRLFSGKVMTPMAAAATCQFITPAAAP